MTSKCSSWRQKVRQDVNNTSLCQKVRHDVKIRIGYIMTSKTSSWRQKVCLDIKVCFDVKNYLSEMSNTIFVRFMCCFAILVTLTFHLFLWYLSTMQVSYTATSISWQRLWWKGCEVFRTVHRWTSHVEASYCPC